MKLNKFRGLNVLKNSFQDSSDTLELIHNAVITQEDIISKRRGYGDFLSVATATPLNLMDYKSKLINIGDNEIQAYNQDSNYNYVSTTPLTGQDFTITFPRYVQAAGNAYVTTDDYVLKLEDTSSLLLKSGVVKAPDLTYLTIGSGSVYSPANGIHTPDTQIGYRVLFGRKDINGNLVIGAPSELTQNNNNLFKSSSVTLASFNVTTTYTSHGLVVNDFVTIKNSNGSNPVPDGEYVVTVVPDANNFTIDTSATLVSAPSGVTSLEFGKRITPKLDFTIPDEVNTVDFLYQIFRTDASILGSVEPDESTLQKIYEANLTPTDLSTGYVTFVDEIDDLFKQAYLYTNPNTGEGINEANYPPPKCDDIALFKNHLFFSSPEWNATLNVNLIRAQASTFINGDYIDVVQTDGEIVNSSIWQSGTTVRYSISNSNPVFIGTYINFQGFIHPENNGKYLITGQGPGYVDVTNPNRTDSTLNESLVGPIGYFVRRYTAASSSSYGTSAGGDFTLTTSSPSVAINIDLTARDIVKTINRDPLSNIYASYTSSSLSLPGQMYFYAKINSSNFAIQASSTDVGDNFDPVLPVNAENITKVVGVINSFENGIAISKFNEFEAVPLLSYLLVGSKTASIKRIMALKNSLIILKEDGVFRLSGTTRSDFTVTQLDPSVIIKATESASILNGYVYCLSNKGVVQISETSVAIVSNDILPYITELLSNINVNTQTYGNSQESNSFYLLTTIAPNKNTASITYCYNTQNSTWTTWDLLFKQGVVQAVNDTFYSVMTNNSVTKERKLQTKLDFCDKSTRNVTLNSISPNKLTVVALSTLQIEAGDIFVFNNKINRIKSVLNSEITFYSTVNFTITDTVEHYKRIVTELITSPVISSDVGMLKQFSEQTTQFRNDSCSTIDMAWVSDFLETKYYTWNKTSTKGGWGSQPWGNFPWGEGETILNSYVTKAGQPCREFIPLNAQVTTWIKLKFKHYQAAESILLQEIDTVERKISRRNSR